MKLASMRLQIVALAMLITSTSLAMPWADMDDALRQDLTLLNQYGVINSSVSTWPVSWGDVYNQLKGVNTDDLPDNMFSVYQRVYKESVYQSKLRKDFYLDVAVANDHLSFRDFADDVRENASFTIGHNIQSEYFAIQTRLTAVHDAQDEQTWRYDDSYFAVLLNNWAFSLGKQARWWGPGWSSSMILGNNARPITALSLDRNMTTAFSSPWLQWMGRWNLRFMFGQLEKQRFVASPYLIGARFSFQPSSQWELAVSRTAMWGGEGRPQSVSSFLDIMTGTNENADAPSDIASQPGNQLAGFDTTYHFKFFNVGLSSYAQLIGEDESGGLPSRLNALFGLQSSWLDSHQQLWLAYLEYQDTRSGAFFSDWRQDYAYEHQVYQSGYRYFGRSLASNLDNDSTAWQLGLQLKQHDIWHSLTLAYRKLNIDGSQISFTDGGGQVESDDSSIWSLTLQGKMPLWRGFGRWRLGYTQDNVIIHDYQHDKLYIQLGWSNR